MDLSDVKLSTPEQESQEVFDDAPEQASSSTPNHARSRSNASSSRSLTDRNQSPPASMSGRSLTSRRTSSKSIPQSPPEAARNRSTSPHEEATPRPNKGIIQETDIATVSPHLHEVNTSRSPVLTARRKSFEEHLDEIQLGPKTAADSSAAKAANSELGFAAEVVVKRGRAATTSSAGSHERPGSSGADTIQSSHGSVRSATISGDGPANAARSSVLLNARPAAPFNVSRKLSAPFAWLSRRKPSYGGSGSGSGTSPPAPLARHASMGGTNADLMLGRLDEERSGEQRLPAKELLKERFKAARMREEVGINIESLDELSAPATRIGSAGSGAAGKESSKTIEDLALGIQPSKPVMEVEDGNMSPISPTHKIPGSTPMSPTAERAMFKGFSSANRTRSSSVASSLDPNLAPGTVVGLHAGPSAMSDPEAPVDWDLWQSLVYEGPAAVAKTSPAELNRAIATGIPHAIRGVVWQVLAGSKNAELEIVYRELIVRGTDKEQPAAQSLARSPGSSDVTVAPAPASSAAPASVPNSANSLASTATASTNKESLASETSSVKSATSTPATTNGMTSPVGGNGGASGNSSDAEGAAAKMQAQAAQDEASRAADRQRQAKEEQAALKKLEKTIRKDLGSRSNYSKYAVATGMQEALFGVCKAYALFDEAVGYAQGMNFIVMPLLFNMPEDEAFCLLVKLMNQYHLRELFLPEMPGLHLHLYQFERLLEDVEPALCYHLHKRGIVPSLYATPWFLTLFAYRFPLQLVLRIYDLVLSEGLEPALLRFAIALMSKNAKTLMELNDMAALKTFLNERIFDVYIDRAPTGNSLLEAGFFGSAAAGASDRDVYRADLLVQDACNVRLTAEDLKGYTADFETRQRLQREREAEIENLRSANASLAARIRVLEAGAEKHDSDHVQLATEMIRAKVEHEELRTAHTALQSEAAALRVTVAAQPGEVEARMREELERTMSRNLEVQNENRALEEAMAEMERELVATKMQFAEINVEHDTLKQRWTDLKKALEH